LATGSPNPAWFPRRLRTHYLKRLREDVGCFEDLLGISAGSLTEAQYELRSIEAVDTAWAEYEGESSDGQGSFLEARAFFVDDDLVVAITDGFRREFFTCFHEHFGRDKPHGVDPPPGTSLGQRRLRYIQHLESETVGGLIRNVRKIRGIP
jgi:hypothetical protein